MNYPLISEYVEAIKFAEDNFDELSYLRPVLDDNGNLVMSSGNFAVVFKMKDTNTGKLYAVKCFLKEQEERKERYRLIADELEYVSSNYICGIKYLEKELFVDSNNTDTNEFDVLLMDWVEGITLDKYIRNHTSDAYELHQLTYQFCKMAAWLLMQPFAHGDLKPDNILVRANGTLTLVDYDGMFVSAMSGRKANELGSRDYRHPLRTEEDFNEHMDDFSLASIALSLKAIALSPDLLQQYGSGDHLLFTEKDYRDLSKSEAIAALQPLMADAELTRLYGLFLIAHSQQELSAVSFRLFNLVKPKKEAFVVEEVLSTIVTKEDLANAWTDEFGVKYSADRKRLLDAPEDLDSYSIKDGTKVIGDSAFSGCDSLRSVKIPASIKNIGGGVFAFCNKLNVICDSNMFYVENYTLYNKIEGILINCWGSFEKFTIPDSVTSIGDSAFSCCESLQSINIPDSVTSIGDSAFSCCESLQSINIPDSVTSIGNSAFYYCKSLQSINIPDSVTSIGDSAFSWCDSLRSINIPDSVTSIGDSAFSCCESLQSINIPQGTRTKFEKLLPAQKDKLKEI